MECVLYLVPHNRNNIPCVPCSYSDVAVVGLIGQGMSLLVTDSLVDTGHVVDLNLLSAVFKCVATAVPIVPLVTAPVGSTAALHCPTPSLPSAPHERPVLASSPRASTSSAVPHSSPTGHVSPSTSLSPILQRLLSPSLCLPSRPMRPWAEK